MGKRCFIGSVIASLFLVFIFFSPASAMPSSDDSKVMQQCNVSFQSLPINSAVKQQASPVTAIHNSRVHAALHFPGYFSNGYLSVDDPPGRPVHLISFVQPGFTGQYLSHIYPFQNFW